MQTKFLLLCVFLIFAFTVAGCKKKNNESKTPVNTLLGTKWKFVGFFDIEKNKLVALEKDCDNCYSLSFDNDSMISGKALDNYFTGYYYIKSDSLSIKKVLSTKVSDSKNKNSFVFIISNEIETFELISDTTTERQLKLFYNTRKKYLLFK